jgi:hypothetical protein
MRSTQLWRQKVERAFEMGFVPKHRRGGFRPKVERHNFLLKLRDQRTVHLPDWKSVKAGQCHTISRCAGGISSLPIFKGNSWTVKWSTIIHRPVTKPLDPMVNHRYSR